MFIEFGLKTCIPTFIIAGMLHRLNNRPEDDIGVKALNLSTWKFRRSKAQLLHHHYYLGVFLKAVYGFPSQGNSPFPGHGSLSNPDLSLSSSGCTFSPSPARGSSESPPHFRVEIEVSPDRSRRHRRGRRPDLVIAPKLSLDFESELQVQKFQIIFSDAPIIKTGIVICQIIGLNKLQDFQTFFNRFEDPGTRMISAASFHRFVNSMLIQNDVVRFTPAWHLLRIVSKRKPTWCHLEVLRYSIFFRNLDTDRGEFLTLAEIESPAKKKGKYNLSDFFLSEEGKELKLL
jgi:hypothetical protein